MPSQFRFFGSGLKPDTQSTNGEPSGNGTSIVETIRNVVAPSSSEVIDPPSLVAEPPDDNNHVSGLHDVIKNTDFWFNYELSLLEKYAVAQAVEWSKAGIPRQDAPLEGELPIETTLKARASEIFQEWIGRVKRKVQDSIQAACAEAGDKIVQFRHVFAQLERNTGEINTTEAGIRDREETLRSQQKTFGAEAFLSKWFYLPLFLVLALIDWIANVPIFTELLPTEFGSRKIWQQLAVIDQKSGTMGGVKMLFDRILFHPDVSIFALGVVVFLVLMAHFTGQALRCCVVFDPKDEPLLAPVLKAQRRQWYLPLFAGALGVLLAVSFLYFSRQKLIDATQASITRAEQELANAETKVRAAKEPQGDLSKLPELQQRLNDTKSSLEDWHERGRFAADIGMMNKPIFLLNLVLALTAMTAAYCAAAPKVVEGKLVDPIIPELKAKLASLRIDVVNQRQSLRALDADIQTFISRAKYLAGTHPLAEWEAKTQRLNAVVTLFRAENARARGVDPESIIAFRQRSTVEFPPVPDEAFQVPADLTSLDEEFRTLRDELRQHMAGEVHPRAVGAGA
jgi:hypothetical protein